MATLLAPSHQVKFRISLYWKFNFSLGGPSPSVGRNIGMGYVPLEYAKPGTELQVKVRKNQFSATVAKMPFVPCTYYSKK